MRKAHIHGGKKVKKLFACGCGLDAAKHHVKSSSVYVMDVEKYICRLMPANKPPIRISFLLSELKIFFFLILNKLNKTIKTCLVIPMEQLNYRVNDYLN